MTCPSSWKNEASLHDAKRLLSPNAGCGARSGPQGCLDYCSRPSGIVLRNPPPSASGCTRQPRTNRVCGGAPPRPPRPRQSRPSPLWRAPAAAASTRAIARQAPPLSSRGAARQLRLGHAGSRALPSTLGTWPPATSPRPQSARGRAGRGVSVVRLSGSLRADVKVGEAVSNSARWCHDAMATRSVDPAGETNAAAGNSSVTMNPPDPTFAAYAVPPCTSKLRFAIASPSPVPVPHSTKQSPDDWNRTRR